MLILLRRQVEKLYLFRKKASSSSDCKGEQALLPWSVQRAENYELTHVCKHFAKFRLDWIPDSLQPGIQVLPH